MKHFTDDIYNADKPNAGSLYTPKLINFKQEPMFLGSGRNTQRFDDPKIPFFDKSNDEQQGKDWKHDETPLIKDTTDFKTILKNAEKFIVTVNLQKLIFLDSIQGRGPFLIFGQITTLPELENVILTWNYFEAAKHSRTYTEMLRAYYDKPSDVFDESFEIPELMKIAKKISSYYDRAYFNVINYIYKEQRCLDYTQEELAELKKSIVMLWVEINILEGMRFYPGFAAMWGLKESQDLMSGLSDNLQLICLHPETDVLTKEGWKKVEMLSLDDEIAQWDMDTGLVSFTKPTRKIWRHYKGDMHRIVDATGKTIQHITKDHEVVVQRRHNKTKVLKNAKVQVQDVKLNGSVYFPQGGKLENLSDIKISTLDRFRIASQADGYINTRITGKHKGKLNITFSLKKQSKIDNLLNYCKELNFDIIERSKTKKGVRIFSVLYPICINITKDLDWVDFHSTEYIDSILMELIKWDGSDANDGSHGKYCIFTSEPKVANKMTALITLSSYKSFNYKQVNKGKDSYKDSYKLYFRDDVKIISTQNYNQEIYDYDGMIGCVTMPKGTIITKSVNEKICVTSNCRDENLHLALTQFVIKILKKNKSEGFTEIYKELQPDIEARYYEAYQEECDWIDYMFSQGSYIGMNANILKDYLNYVTIRRMKSIGIKIDHTKMDRHIIKNPIPWVDTYINMDSNEKLPQQEQILNYVTGGVEQDMDGLTDLIKTLLS